MKGSPYVGPRPFGKEDAAFFRGREREARDLVALIQAHPVVLIYAPSGAGKTSLLSAKVVPELETRGCFVLPLARVGGESSNADDAKPTENVFALNVLANLQKSSQGELTSLRETLLAKDKEKNPPGTLPTLTVLIIDQFEELFTKHVDAWKQRQPFFQSLADTLSENGRLRLVFAMREEYLASLDPYRDLMPGGLEISYRLPLLGSDAALRAVVEPALEAGVSFEPGVAEDLVESLQQISSGQEKGRLSEYVEPLQLQVVCKTVWDALAEGSKSISESNLAKYGNVEDALEHYYNDTLRMLMEELRPRKLKVHEVAIRDWIEDKFILADGTRALYCLKGDRPASVQQITLNVLDRQHVLRPELRAGSRWYELSHDRFVGPIQTSNSVFRQQGGDGLESLLAHVARNWEATRAKKLLLSGQQLKDAEALIEGAEGQAFPVSRAVRELVQASRVQADMQASDARFRFALGVAALFAVAIALVVAFFVRKESLVIAERAREAATVSRQLAQNPETRISALLYGVLSVGRSLEAHREPLLEADEALWDISFGIGPETVLERTGSAPRSLEFSADSKRLFAVAYRGTDIGNVLSVDTETGRTLWRADKGQSSLNAGFAPTAQSPSQLPAEPPPIRIYSRDESVVVEIRGTAASTVEPRTGKPLRQFVPAKTDPVGRFDVDPEGHYVAYITGEGVISVWDAASGKTVDHLEPPTQLSLLMRGVVAFVAKFSEDGAFMVAGPPLFAGDGKPILLAWKIGEHKPAAIYSFERDQLIMWDALTGGRAVGVAPSNGTLEAYVLNLNAPPPEKLEPYIRVREPVVGQWMRGNALGLTIKTDKGNVLRIWNLKDPEPVSSISMPEDVGYVAISPDLQHVATIRGQQLITLEPVLPTPHGDEDLTHPRRLVQRGCHQLANQQNEYSRIARLCSAFIGARP